MELTLDEALQKGIEAHKAGQIQITLFISNKTPLVYVLKI